jgi:glycerol kinase
MQFQADQLGIPVETSALAETTARGAAFLAGLAIGFWPGLDALEELARPGRRFEPAMPDEQRGRLYAGWLEAVGRVSSSIQTQDDGANSARNK